MTAPVPILVVLLASAFWRGIALKHHLTPFLCALGGFALCFAGPGNQHFSKYRAAGHQIWHAAAPPQSQAFLLVGAVVLVPMILIYTGFAYYVFRGKVVAETTYH